MLRGSPLTLPAAAARLTRRQQLPQRVAAAATQRRCIAHGTADLDWSSMMFDYVPTNCHIEYTWKDGEWSEGKIIDAPMVEMHILSSVLHYGQALFEGLKVFSRADGTIAQYQPYGGNVDRMARGCARLGMPTVEADMFNGAIERVVMENLEYVPPYGAGGAMYVRPFIFGCGAKLGLGMAPEYKFIVAVNPVGDYYSGGLSALDGMVQTDYDRAAGKGIGGVKAGGNYAADVVPSAQASAAGYPIALYLDATEHKYVEEFSTSNFIAIDKEGNYVTPQSDSILKSVTNMSLRQIAMDLGMGVQERPVEYAEVGSFSEVAACGYASYHPSPDSRSSSQP
jgi:branched-chain amino acid aminotransferase